MSCLEGRERLGTVACLPITASSQDALVVVLHQHDSDSPLVTGHLRALPHHKLDQPPTPHQQAAILSTTQDLQLTQAMHQHSNGPALACGITQPWLA